MSFQGSIEAVVAANDRLAAWSGYLEKFEEDAGAGLPPAAMAEMK